jgi:hypothetical protein
MVIDFLSVVIGALAERALLYTEKFISGAECETAEHTNLPCHLGSHLVHTDPACIVQAYIEAPPVYTWNRIAAFRI